MKRLLCSVLSIAVVATAGLTLLNAGSKNANELLSPSKANFLGVSQQNPIKLSKAFCMHMSGKYAGGTETRNFEVLVENLAYDKKISVVHKKDDGSWTELPMSYKQSVANNKELWQLHYSKSTIPWDSSPSNIPSLGDEFAIKYSVNGQDFWDNNNGKNYTITNNDGPFIQEGLDIDVNEANSYFGSYDNKIRLMLDVRNISSTKDVKVHYSTDDWNSVQVSNAQYQGYITTGYSCESIYTPNKFGIEVWRFENLITNTQSKTFKYVVSYNLNGNEIIDNNFGSGYEIKIN